MFTSLFKQRVPQEAGESLWTQCYWALVEIQNEKGSTEIDLAEVDRLVVFVGRQHLRGDFHLAIQETIADSANGFNEHIPY